MLISPAKSLKMERNTPEIPATQCDFLAQSQQLLDALRPRSVTEIAELMTLSPTLAQLTVQRFQDMQFPFTPSNAKQAIYAFDGDVYAGIDIEQISAGSIDYLQSHLRILSGLYGLLRPLDLIQAYRLEMGTALTPYLGQSLYGFWKDQLTPAVNAILASQTAPVVVNLASEEYFSAIQRDALIAPVITPVFEDEKSGKYKIISFYAKKARGMMVRYAAEQKITDAQALKSFNMAGYAYSPEHSSDQRWVFRRAAATQ
jgi:cytoplasmic iron level regulating protein YaaA (DUF328/UPF0246 family)